MPSSRYMFIPLLRRRSRKGQMKDRLSEKLHNKDQSTITIATNFAWEQLKIIDYDLLKVHLFRGGQVGSLHNVWCNKCQNKSLYHNWKYPNVTTLKLSIQILNRTHCATDSFLMKFGKHELCRIYVQYNKVYFKDIHGFCVEWNGSTNKTVL